MGMSEEQFRAKLREIAELYGWECYHTHRSDRSDAGWPDEVYCKPPRVIFAELKRDRVDGGKAATAKQKAWLQRLADCGLEVALWRPKDLQTILRVLGPRRERAVLDLRN